MTTWEYPPYKVGGIASHCYDLSRALARQGHNVHILAYGNEEKTENYDNVTVHRIPSTNAPDTISWAMFLGHRMEKKAIELHKEDKFELVHTHDWMGVPAGVGIKKTLKLPLVFTIHSTESGRVGVHNQYTKMINDLEWYGTYEADQIITVGQDFCNEVRNLFHPPENKLNYIPNGVDIKRFDSNRYRVDRNHFALNWEKIVLFVGRLTHQKGVGHLLNAAPHVLKENSEAKFIIAGTGDDKRNYQNLAKSLKLDDKILFTGYLEEKEMLSMFKTSDIVVAPSVYEPFGIVALESGAAKKPIVGSYTGGLKETIIHEWSGLHSYPADSKSVANELNRALSDDNWAKRMGRQGRGRVEKDYTWNKITNWTTGVYGKAAGLWN